VTVRHERGEEVRVDLFIEVMDLGGVVAHRAEPPTS